MALHFVIPGKQPFMGITLLYGVLFEKNSFYFSLSNRFILGDKFWLLEGRYQVPLEYQISPLKVILLVRSINSNEWSILSPKPHKTTLYGIFQQKDSLPQEVPTHWMKLHNTTSSTVKPPLMGNNNLIHHKTIPIWE